MAIKRADAPAPEGELPLVINNGDYTALTNAVDKLGFKDAESLLRYALAVFSRSATRAVTITDQDGKSVVLNPSDSLLKAAPIKEAK
jgi:hypothetical protein